jgi:SMC interacting uncharacterized protein involved in chromosome segregation
MAARRSHVTNNHLQEAMALLIHNQAAFVEQIARNDQERLALQVKTDKWQRQSDERFKRIEEWQRKSDKRFERIEERLAKIETDLLNLPKTVVQTILDQLPKIRKEIGFKTQ